MGNVQSTTLLAKTIGWKTITVPKVRLSCYINEPIDYLKLDIKGMEEIVVSRTGP